MGKSLNSNIGTLIIVLVAGIVGVGVGTCIALWFKLPDHTVDVFAVVESLMGIGLTALALSVTLGIIRQRADFEIMLATKKDEMEDAVANRVKTSMEEFTRIKLTPTEEKLEELKRQVTTLNINVDQYRELVIKHLDKDHAPQGVVSKTAKQP